MTNKKAERQKRQTLFKPEASGDEQPISIEVDELWELAHILDVVLKYGGMFAVFTSRDQQAYCLQAKFGTDQFRAWQSVSDPRMTTIDEFWDKFTEPDQDYKLAQAYTRKTSD